MQFPSSKVVFAVLAALASASAVVIGANGVPTTHVDWLKTIAAILAVAGSVGGASYAKTENRPPTQLVNRIKGIGGQ